MLLLLSRLAFKAALVATGDWLYICYQLVWQSPVLASSNRVIMMLC